MCNFINWFTDYCIDIFPSKISTSTKNKYIIPNTIKLTEEAKKKTFTQYIKKFRTHRSPPEKKRILTLKSLIDD